MTTDADAYVSSAVVRFVPHFGSTASSKQRLKGIPDEGMVLELEGARPLDPPGALPPLVRQLPRLRPDVEDPLLRRPRRVARRRRTGW
jgi:hypothetical protein